MTITADVRAIVDLLRDPYQLDPAGVAALAELASGLPVKSTTRLVFSVLEELREPAVQPTVIRFIRNLVDAKPELRRSLTKSFKRGGRCPAGARALLVEVLGLTGPPKPHKTSLRRQPAVDTAPLGKRGELLLNPTTTSVNALPRLFESLANLDPFGEVTVRVSDFVYASGLAIVATWANTQGAIGRILPQDRYTDMYLKRIGFHEALRGIDVPAAPDVDDWSVRLTPIGLQSRVDDLTDRILSILETFIHPSDEDRSSFGTLFGELIENVNRHAAVKTPGFIVAQVYPQRYRLQVTIADPGIGIKRSFLEGDVPRYKEPSKSDAYFIRLALQPLVTSKTAHHAGYGLYILSNPLRVDSAERRNIRRHVRR